MLLLEAGPLRNCSSSPPQAKAQQEGVQPTGGHPPMVTRKALLRNLAQTLEE